MGGIGAVAEPLVVISLLICGTWMNRDPDPGRSWVRGVRRYSSDVESMRAVQPNGVVMLLESDAGSRSTSPSLLAVQEPKWRRRTLRVGALRKEVITPNTRQFKDHFLSRLLERFPFLVECWYWGLIYWV
jgi:hypothetical protein